ncbi:hypothetical protein IAT38_007137 [Cryptococcus sp. DSM 104549]
MPFTSTIIITGGTSGLGYATALSLSRSQPNIQIIIASRSSGDNAASRIIASSGNSNVAYIPLDLSTHASTRTFARTFLAGGYPPISALLLNAAIQVIPKLEFSADGIEVMFATNHVNHALLFFLLRGQLTNNARIVLTSSSGHDPKLERAPAPHYTTGEETAHPPTGAKWDTQAEGFRRYSLSKLCNILFAYALARKAREQGYGWTVMALDPGIMATSLYRWNKGLLGAAFSWALQSRWLKWFVKDLYTPDFSAATLAKMAVGPGFEGESKTGRYYVVLDAKETESSAQSHEVALQDDLWEWTLKEVAEGDEVKAWRNL